MTSANRSDSSSNLGPWSPRASGWRLPAWVIIAVCLVAAGGRLWSLGASARQTTPENDEKQIRQAAFRYYAGMVLGDEAMCVGAVAFPIYSVRNGTGKLVDEKSLRAVVAEVIRRRKSSDLTDEVRKRIAANTLAVFEEASIQFIGGDTASVVFVIRPASSRDLGDTLAQLVLYRRGGQWRVIAEFTDSKPAPAFTAEPPTEPDPSLEKRP